MVFGALEIAAAKARAHSCLRAEVPRGDILTIRVGTNDYVIGARNERTLKRVLTASPFKRVLCKIENESEEGATLIIIISRPTGASRIVFPVSKLK